MCPYSYYTMISRDLLDSQCIWPRAYRQPRRLRNIMFGHHLVVRLKGLGNRSIAKLDNARNVWRIWFLVGVDCVVRSARFSFVHLIQGVCGIRLPSSAVLRDRIRLLKSIMEVEAGKVACHLGLREATFA